MGKMKVYQTGFANQSERGFSLVELLLVMGVAAILFGLTTVNLVNVQHHTTIATATESLVADMRSQQIKAMAGKTTSSGTGDKYGIHFDGTSTYILFHGTYAAGSPDNVAVTPDQAIAFTANPAEVTFSQITGEIGASQTITAKYISGSETKTITMNKYGVVTGIN